MKVNRIMAVVLCLCVVLSLTVLPVKGEDLPDGFSSWDEYYNYLVFGNTKSEDTPPLHQMHEVGRNEKLVMYYFEDGADLYLEDISTGKVWGTAVDNNYFDTTNQSKNAVSNLLTVCYAGSDDNIKEADLTGASTDDFTVTNSYEKNSVKLNISMPKKGIKFQVIFSLLDDGVSVNIPFNSIKEEKNNYLVSMRVLPLFGVANPGEDGYIFYPDGSGALMKIENYKPTEPSFYQYSIYCEDKADFSTFDSNHVQDIKSLMLPVFGIKHSIGGIFAEILSGAENAILHMNCDNFYQSYFEMIYRTHETVSYDFSTKSSNEINKIGNNPMKGDRTICYHVLASDKNTYSDMAVLYRNLMVERGILKKKIESETIPLSIELFMGISKNGVLGNKIQRLTDFSDAENIVSDLYDNGVNKADYLLKGWCKGGYDTLPTTGSAENNLGGQSQLNKLSKTVTKCGGRLYLLSDFVNANKKTGSFNAQKDALRDALNSTIFDSDKVRCWLNPTLSLEDLFNNLKKSQKNDSAVCFDGLGSWLLSDTGEKHETSRAESVKTIKTVLKNALQQDKTTAVMGGNSYVWSDADRMFDIPDNDSCYYQTTRTIPFYQMVVHGYIDYSALAANLSYDYNYQKLRFVETGSIPHFLLTQNSPNLLQGTSYESIFSSEYSIWKEVIIKTYNQMNEKIGDKWSLTMDSHTYLSDTLVQVKYSDGSSVYINYANEEANADGKTIPAMDYLVVGGQK